MINGLINSFEELNGLKTIYVDELQTGLVSQTEINALDGITSNIQTQIDNLQTALGGINITISGNTLSGVVLLPYLEMYYYTQTDVKGKIEESYNKIIENQTTNYYNKLKVMQIIIIKQILVQKLQQYQDK